MNRLFLYLASSLYTLLIVCMGFATIMGKLYGEDHASTHIYGSWWFASMWGLLAFVSLLLLIRKKVHKRLGVMLLHVSFLVILAGALITHLTSEDGTVHLRKGSSESSFVGDDGSVHGLPFVMNLKDFEVVNYPGTDAVMDYRCTVSVMNMRDVQELVVSMNNIGKYGGYRFYQSAYDEDGEGTQLLVAYDPYGIAVSYTGYLLLLVSLLWVMFSRHTRIRHLYHKAVKPVMAMLLLFSVSATAMAQDDITPVNKEIADGVGDIAVLYGGRICPLNTAAIEFVTKLSGKSSWQGYSANEIFVGWMIYYTQWETQKIIRVKSREVQQMIGIEDGWASVRDFYTSKHEYKLAGKSNDLSLPATVRKAVREADEKLQVVTMFYNSEMLRIFPLAVEGKLQWYTPGSTELPLGTPSAEFQFINHVMDYLTQSILVDDVAGALKMIAKIKLYQKEKAADVMPSQAMLRVEVIYNSLLQARWIVYVFLLFSIVFCLLQLSGKIVGNIRYVHSVFLILAMLWITALLALRWCISGHVPMSNGYETMLFMAWIALMVSVLCIKKLPLLKAFGPVVAAFCMLVSVIASGSPQVTPLMPVLNSPLLTIHVAVVMISYSLFAMISLMSGYGIWLHHRCVMLERNGKTAVSESMRSAQESLSALTSLLVYPAVALLAIGIFIGAVWANISWGSYWSWDAKETWALITLMVYAVPLHGGGKAWSPVKLHIYCLLAFLVVLMTYFGVNMFLPGMHSYA